VLGVHKSTQTKAVVSIAEGNDGGWRRELMVGGEEASWTDAPRPTTHQFHPCTT